MSLNPWFGVVVLVAAGSAAAPCAQAQEAEAQVDSTEVSVTGSLGLRLVFGDVASPGVRGQLTLARSTGRVWASMGFIAQMIHWTVQDDPHTRRYDFFIRRYAFGVGTDEGPSAFVFFEGGKGTDSLRGSRHDVLGIGLGAGYTVGRMTAAVELNHGEIRRIHPPPSYPFPLYTLLGVSVLWRLF